MIISNSPKFIFIAVPKTGTSSVEEVLKPMANKRLRKKFNKHVTSNRLKRELQPARWDSSFKFAFVRNPYEWMRSWYRFRQRKALKSDSHAFRDRYTGDKTFNEFVQSFSHNELMLRQSSFIANPEGELLVDFVGHY